MTDTNKLSAKAECHDCGRPYGEPGFPDLTIPNDAWRQISPTGDQGGLLCPSCICARLDKKKIKCYGAFMSGPIKSISEVEMYNLRWIENCRETLEGNGLTWKPPKVSRKNT